MTGVVPVPEILGDSDKTEALVLVASLKQIQITGRRIGNSTTIGDFIDNLDAWAINGDGTTTATTTPVGIQYVDDRGKQSGDRFVVLQTDYTEQAGKVTLVQYVIKLLQVKV